MAERDTTTSKILLTNYPTSRAKVVIPSQDDLSLIQSKIDQYGMGLELFFIVVSMTLILVIE